MTESAPGYTKALPLSLKAHPQFNERWLQNLIAEDPALLGLGDLDVKDVERRQPRAGRLDLLLADSLANTRYEVEIQLGATDESHIIRTIEYWDLERARYPMYDHVAVIVAEDVTARFLNIISLLNRSVPLIAVQLNAWQLGNAITLTATKILDLVPVGDDEDEESGPAVDRGYWEANSSPESIHIADDMLQLVHEVTGDMGFAQKYTKSYIGLARSGLPINFMTVAPRKRRGVALVELKVPRSDEFTSQLAEAGIDVVRYDNSWRCYIVRITSSDLVENRALLGETIKRAWELRSGTSGGGP